MWNSNKLSDKNHDFNVFPLPPFVNCTFLSDEFVCRSPKRYLKHKLLGYILFQYAYSFGIRKDKGIWHPSFILSDILYL